MFKQKFRPVDTRESVLINKLAVEYRNIQALTNGQPIQDPHMAGEILEVLSVALGKRPPNKRLNRSAQRRCRWVPLSLCSSAPG